MRKIIFLMVLLLLAYGVAAGVITYSGATVTTGSAKVKIVSTDEALLALNPGDDPANLVTISDGVLSLEFTFTPGQEQNYTFHALFKVTNNSAEYIDFTVESEGISYISVRPSGISDYFVSNGSNTGYYHPLSSGQSAEVEVSIFIPEGVDVEVMDGSLTVKAQVTP